MSSQMPSISASTPEPLQTPHSSRTLPSQSQAPVRCLHNRIRKQHQGRCKCRMHPKPPFHNRPHHHRFHPCLHQLQNRCTRRTRRRHPHSHRCHHKCHPCLHLHLCRHKRRTRRGTSMSHRQSCRLRSCRQSHQHNPSGAVIAVANTTSVVGANVVVDVITNAIISAFYSCAAANAALVKVRCRRSRIVNRMPSAANATLVSLIAVTTPCRRCHRRRKHHKTSCQHSRRCHHKCRHVRVHAVPPQTPHSSRYKHEPSSIESPS